jgi:putative endonuclease
MKKNSYVYIMANHRGGTIYIGVTSNIEKRVYEHKNKLVEGFTKKYNLNMLVYLEVCENIEQAIEFEKRLKGWNRLWKIRLIEKENPDWIDLSIKF